MGHWHGSMGAMKAGGNSTHPDHLLPWTPSPCEAARERRQEGMISWWNTARGGTHAIPGAGKCLQQVAAPCSCFCWQPDSCTIHEKTVQIQRATLPIPNQPPEHTVRELFLSNTGVSFTLTRRSPDICFNNFTWGEPQSDRYTRELLFFSWCGIYLHQNNIINLLQWKAHWLPATHCLMHFALVFHLALWNHILKVTLHFQGTSGSKLWIMCITTFSCKLWRYPVKLVCFTHYIFNILLSARDLSPT